MVAYLAWNKQDVLAYCLHFPKTYEVTKSGPPGVGDAASDNVGPPNPHQSNKEPPA